jgi:hypothetical protein
LLPAGAVAGWGLHPLESAALSRRTPDSDVGLGTTLRWNFRGADAAPGLADSYNPFIVETGIKIISASTAARRDACRSCIDGGAPLIHLSITRLPGRRSPEFIRRVRYRHGERPAVKKLEFAMHGTTTNVRNEVQRAAREKAYATPLSEFHPGNPELFRSDTLWPYFERLRNEEPVHFCATSPVGNYWSVTKYNDIMHVDTTAGIFSSDLNLGGVLLRDVEPEYQWPSFIAMDEPKHAPQRKTVSPMFTPTHLDKLAILIRERDLVRFSVGRSPQTDAMVRSRHRPAEKHDLR